MFRSPKKRREMIHELAVTYGISPREAERLKEIDYYVMVGNENLKNARAEFIRKTYESKE